VENGTRGTLWPPDLRHWNKNIFESQYRDTVFDPTGEEDYSITVEWSKGALKPH